MFEIWFFSKGGYQVAKRLLAGQGFYTGRELEKFGFGTRYYEWATHQGNTFRAVYLRIDGTRPYWFYSLEDVRDLEKRRKRFECKPDVVTFLDTMKRAVSVDFRETPPVRLTPGERKRLGVCHECGRIHQESLRVGDVLKAVKTDMQNGG